MTEQLSDQIMMYLARKSSKISMLNIQSHAKTMPACSYRNLRLELNGSSDLGTVVSCCYKV